MAKTKWLDFLMIGILTVPLLLFSLFTAPPKAEKRVPSFCDVHQKQLQQDKVALLYGLPVYDMGYWEAREKKFPHSKPYVEGGCLPVENDPGYRIVDYCPKCRKAETEWRRARAASQK